MPRLSIIIPLYERVDLLESTLISVLENRPHDCEIIVLHSGNYSNPYNLEDEVHFICTPPNQGGTAGKQLHLPSSLAELLPGIGSPVVHLLSAGCIVEPGWTDGVDDWFDDPFVGSISPVLLNRDGTVFCTGVENSYFYKTRLLNHGVLKERLPSSGMESVGPSQIAAFYRTDALRQLSCLGELGTTTFGMEIALALEATGFESDQATESVIQIVDPAEILLDSGQDAQNAIWRFAGSIGFLQGFAMASAAVGKDLLMAAFSKSHRTSLRGRVSHFMNWKAALGFRDVVDEADGPTPNRISIATQRNELSLSGLEESNSAKSGIHESRRAA